MNTRPLAVGVLSLVAAGVIGGGFALAMSQNTPQQPVQLRQVVATETATPSTTTATPAAEPTATTAPAPKPAAKVRQVAPEPAPAATTPDPTTPEPAPRTPSPIKPGPGRLVTATCGGAGCPTGK